MVVVGTALGGSPAQIRTCGTATYGSYLGCLAMVAAGRTPAYQSTQDAFRRTLTPNAGLVAGHQAFCAPPSPDVFRRTLTVKDRFGTGSLRRGSSLDRGTGGENG